MAYIQTKGKFHCAIDGQGLILQGAPDRPAYQQQQAPVYGRRFASGDRGYNDLSQWWYFRQTDWSGGIKDDVSWRDDARFYYSTNIDTISENGAIKLHHNQVLDNTFPQQISCGTFGEINGVPTKIIGTYGVGEDAMSTQVWAQTTGSWVNITPTARFTGDIIQSVNIANGLLWVTSAFRRNGFTHIAGVGMIYSYDGTTWTDRTAAMATSLGILNFMGVMWTLNIGANIFVGCNTQTRAFIARFNGSTWSSILSITTPMLMIDGQHYGGRIYYLLNTRTINSAIGFELRAYDLVSLADISVYRWDGLTGLNFGTRMGKLLNVAFGNLIIGIGAAPGEVWSYNGSVMTKLWSADDSKTDIGSAIAIGNVSEGGIVKDNKVYWHNLIYNGTSFSHWISNITDTEWSLYIPLFVYESTIYGRDNELANRLYRGASTYKGAVDKNFIVFNNFDLLSGIEKLAHSATILFRPLVSGQRIVVEYLSGEIDGNSVWTVLGNASHAIDGGVVHKKVISFPSGTLFNKIWFRIKLESNGSNTPTVNDLVMEYLPIPTYKKVWQLHINCADDLRRLDGGLHEMTGRELKSRLETAWWTKSLLDFQDLDYATTTLNGSLSSSATTITVNNTDDFPEQGRIKIGSEEIFYTNKTPQAFIGCSRGVRDTVAAPHLNNATVNNTYRVLITDINVRAPILLRDKQLEYIVQLNLREG